MPAEDYVSESGRLVIKTALPFKGEQTELRLVFPFDYPDIEPTVLGPPGLLPRHQNRRVGNFCLLEDAAASWWPGMSAAQLVNEDLRKLFADSEAGSEAVRAGEADMPEPFSQQISADAGCVVVAPDPFWRCDVDNTEGELVLHDKSLGTDSQVMLSADGFGSADTQLVKGLLSSSGSRHIGRWVALPEVDSEQWPTAQELLSAGEAASTQLLGRLRRVLKQQRKRPTVDGWVGVTFIEEGPRRGEHRRGWVFLLVGLGRDGERVVRRVARVQALTAAERARRIPELAGLAGARVLVVGIGSVGASVVLELAKAGVGRLELVDDDHYDVNNAVRHVLEPRWAGASKAIALAIEAEELNPFIDATPHPFKVGEAGAASERLDRLLEQVDLVVDATGSQVAARILARRCHEHEKAMVLASLTAGSYGGEVAVFRPDQPCYYCFVLGQQDGTVPTPLAGPRSNTTPVGCHTPAFSGAGFDATALAALAARVSVAATAKSDYPAPAYDYAIIDFRGEHPWRQGRLSRHPGCPLCG